MKIAVDGQDLFTLSEVQKQVIRNDIPDEIFDEDMKRRILYYPIHKYEQCFKALKKEWLPKLASRMDSIPTKDEDLAKLIFSQPDYKCRSQRDAQQE